MIQHVLWLPTKVPLILKTLRLTPEQNFIMHYVSYLWDIDNSQTISLTVFLCHLKIYYCSKCLKFTIDVLQSFVYFAFLYFSPWGQKLPPKYLFYILELPLFFFIFWNLFNFTNVLHVLSIFRNKVFFNLHLLRCNHSYLYRILWFSFITPMTLLRQWLTQSTSSHCKTLLFLPPP